MNIMSGSSNKQDQKIAPKTALENVNEQLLHCKVLINRGILLLYIMNCLCRTFVVSVSAL